MLLVDMSKKSKIIDLNSIKDPLFLKELNYKELENLASNIRKEIISSVSKNGGHLSSNLGTVESIIALHKVFNFSKDKILFDVGHQSYTHKILTGRNLTNLRKKDGISGFPKISESIYDCFEGGHSSNSLSTALGMALKRDLNHENYDIVCYIGDSSFANGLIFEALNDEIIRNHKIIIILNDNDMSISKSVGNISKTLQKISTSRFYNRLKESYKKSFNKNKLGKFLYRKTYNFKNFIKNIFFRKNIFTIFDLNYIGPIDGHNFKTLIKNFERAKNTTKSVVVHIKTIKGLGFEKAQNDSEGYYHGVAPFKINKDINYENKNSYSFLYSCYIKNLLKKDKNVIAVSPATLIGSDLLQLKKEFQNQVYDVGIAEEHSLSLSAGMALSGLKPYVFIYSTFLQRGFDQVIHDIARLNLNVKILVDRSGFVGQDGSTHLGIFDEAFLLEVPNTVVCMASSKEQCELLVDFSYNFSGFLVIRFPKTNFHSVKLAYNSIKVGQYEYVKKCNSNKVLITFGPILYTILKFTKDYNIDIIESIFQSPISDELVNDLMHYKIIYIYNVYGVENGFNNLLISKLIKLNYKGSIKSYAIKNRFITHRTIEECLEAENLNPEFIINEIKKDD